MNILNKLGKTLFVCLIIYTALLLIGLHFTGIIAL